VTTLYQWAWELWRFLQENHGPITAFATIALAFFTTTLWWATRKLVKAGPPQKIRRFRFLCLFFSS
jgi:hypothetical protein